MIEMFLHNVGLDLYTGTPIVLLIDHQKEKILPIWIDISSAPHIQFAQRRIKSPRPTTHDLLLKVIKETGNEVNHMLIHSVVDGVYMSKLVLRKNGSQENIELDGRPSDFITICELARAPIFISLEVFQDACVSAHPTKEKEDAEEFKAFVSNLKPSDFNKLK